MIATRASFPLLLTKCIHRESHRSCPLRGKGRGVPSCAPIAMRKTNAETERVNLPLALGNAWMHVRKIVDGPRQRLGRLWVKQECICIRVNQDAPTLSPNQPAEHLPKSAVVFRDR